MCYGQANVEFDALFDLETDPDCMRNLRDEPGAWDDCLPRLIEAMRRLEAPSEHFQRLGLDALD
jgi:hypothetical protein